MTRLAAALLLLLLVVSARADASEESLSADVRRVLAAHEVRDADTLARLASLSGTKPWRLTCALGLENRAEVAEAFAAASRRPDGRALVAYARSCRRRGGMPGAAEFLENRAMPTSAVEAEREITRLGPMTFAEDPVLRAWVLRRTAALCAALSRFAEAKTLFRDASDAAREVAFLDLAAEALHAEGQVAHSALDFEGMLDAWRRLVAVQKQRADPTGTARAQAFLGTAHGEVGDYEAAIALLNEAVAGYEALSDLRGLTFALQNTGTVYVRRGDATRALRAFERALDLARETKIAFREAQLLVRLGEVCTDVGQFDRALRLHEQARAVAAAMPPTQARYARLARAESLAGSGSACQEAGRFEEARRHHEEALAIFEELGLEQQVISVLLNDAQVSLDESRSLEGESRQKALERARKRQEDALVRSQRIGDPWAEANAHVALGKTCARSRKPEEALEHLRRAAAIGRDILSDRLVFEALGRIAEVQLETGHIPEALRTSEDALDCVATLVRGLDFVQGARARERHAALLRVGLRAAALQNDVPATVRFVESGRAGAVLESFEERDALLQAAVPQGLRVQEQEAQRRVTAAMARFEAAVRKGVRKPIQRRKREADDARRAIENVVGRIQREAKLAARIVYPKPSRLAEMQHDLDPAEALVLYALEDPDSLAVVVTQDNAYIVPLPAAHRIATTCDELTKSISRKEDAVTVERLSDELRDQILRPLALPSTVRRVLVSPDGPLFRIPFCLLSETLGFATTASGTMHCVLREQAAIEGTGVLALGDPDYGAVNHSDANGPRRRRPGLERIEHTRAEALEVGTVTLLGHDATEAALRRMLNRPAPWAAVHLACHGLVDLEHPLRSALALTASNEDDGYLTVLEVFQLPIRAKLVVLAACRSGVGPVVRGEGLLGLPSAFLHSGSPRVIVSLWKVDDRPTAILMKKFYELWLPSKDGTEGLGAAEALRRAQAYVRTYEREMRDEKASRIEGRTVRKTVRPYAHPRDWAAWVLWGLPE